jgi:hypothetical protein
LIYDIIIVATYKDFHKIKFLYKSIIDNLKNYNKIYCFCPELPSELIENITYIKDIDVLNIDMSSIKIRPNWIYQQYLKLLQNITIDQYLVIDADIIINKPLEIFTNNKPNFLTDININRKPFFYYSKIMFDIDREYEYSFINEIMLFNRNIINEMILTKFENNEDFIKKSNEIITSTCYISEYELYGNYVYKTNKEKYNYVKLFSLALNKFLWSDDDIIELIEKHKNIHFDILKIPTINLN